jgi:hypothetical protein
VREKAPAYGVDVRYNKIAIKPKDPGVSICYSRVCNKVIIPLNKYLEAHAAKQ